MAAWTVANTRDGYTAQIARAEVRPSWAGKFERAASYIMQHRAKYEEVERMMDIPWQLVGALHWREASGSFAGVLHNGDKIIGTGRKTYRVPKGRGPFATWAEAAADAIRIKQKQRPPAWDLEGVAWFMETFNGMGYKNKGRISPYLWSGTTLYDRGKYVSDGVYSSTTVDQQIGLMPLYQLLLAKTKPAEVREKSRKIDVIKKTKLGLGTILTTIGGWFTADNLGLAQSIYPALSGVFTVNTLILGTVMGLGFWLILNLLDKMIMEDAEEGRYSPREV